jgi:hypothetical protein
MEGGDQGSEESVVEAEIETEENKNSGSDGFGEAAIEIHGLVDPVTVTHVPDEAAGIPKGSSLAESKWLS